MGRRCPLGGYALYLDCLECDEKEDCKSGKLNSNSQNNRYRSVQEVQKDNKKASMEEWQS